MTFCNIQCDLNGIDKVEQDRDNTLYIITLAYENPEYVEQFIRLNSKYITSNKKIVVFDSSRDNHKSKEISNICRNYNIIYNHIRVSNDDLHTRIGLKHEFILKFYLNAINAKYVGFIQTDMFYIKEVDMLQKIKEHNIFGTMWDYSSDVEVPPFLWPGNMFFNIDMFSNISFLANIPSSIQFDNNYVIGENGIKNNAFIINGLSLDNDISKILDGFTEEVTTDVIYMDKDKRNMLDKILVCTSLRMSQYVKSSHYIHAFNGSMWHKLDANIQNQKIKKMVDILMSY